MTAVSDAPATAATRPRLLRRALVALVLVLIGVAVLVPLLTATRIWWVARQDDAGPADAVLVLGASQYDGRPSAIFEARLQHALDLYEDGVAKMIVTTGGKQAGDRFTEAAAGRDWLIGHGVPSESITAVESGRTTYDSLAAVAPGLLAEGLGRVVLVSDPWHAHRSRVMASDLGLEAVSSPTRIGPVVQERETQLRYIARETAAFLWYRIAGPDSG
ncbi:MAG: YdcF family protein [Candidatus Nanopelagicales bacterium]